ncbi:MAG: phage major capsid protein [Hyphomicrobiales bacterium]|nr:MAG: phage major capsid protein [Hyphomicrobiales bacterium]
MKSKDTSFKDPLIAMAMTGDIMGSAGMSAAQRAIDSMPGAAMHVYMAANAARRGAQDDAGTFDLDSVVDMPQDRLESNIASHQRLIERINNDASGRTLTAREETRIEEAQESLSVLESEASRRGRPAGRRTNAEVIEDTAAHAQGRGARAHSPIFATPRSGAAGHGGFQSTGEFLNAVILSSAKGAQADPRLMFDAAPTTFGTEGVGADGGFAVPPDFRSAIMQKVMGEDSLLSFTDQQTASGNSITFPADETTPWQSSGGIQAYWEVEGGQKTQSKPALTEKTVKLNKVIALVPLTDELLEDAPAMAGYVNKKAPEKINFKVNDAIINGTGVGMPLGILKSPGTVVVAKESAQAADTVVAANIMKLWSALTPSARRNARWLMNADVESQLMGLQFPGTGTAVPVFMPPGGLADSPYGRLLGRPIVYSEAMPALGDEGDIVFGDLSNYLTAVKSGGVRSDVSIHLWFDYDITAFRFVLRIGGQPWWNSAITPYQAGASTRGFFATLAARA